MARRSKRSAGAGNGKGTTVRTTMTQPFGKRVGRRAKRSMPKR